MGFAAPWFLAGLAAAGLPVWFHLLRKHKTTPLPFSSLMFFERRTQSSIKHRRLEYLLLFALRTALLAMLAVAFAGPFLTGGAAPAGGGKRMTVVAIDNSFSMRQGDRLNRAKQEARQVLSGLRPGDQAQVIAFGGQVRIVGQPGSDPGVLRGSVESVEPTDSRSSYGELVRALRSVARSSRLPLEVHLFSDAQKSSLPPGFADLQLPPGAKLIVHSVAGKRLPNWTVESVSAPRRLYDPKKVSIQATIAGFGTEAAARRVSLVLNGKILETKTADVPSDGRATVEFLSLEAPYGLNRGEVRLDSADSFPDDDRFLFSVERADPRPVLFVHEPRDTRSPLYFRAALEASAQAAFTLEAVTPPQTPAGSPSKYAFVVISNVVSISRNFEDALGKYVRDGGSVWVALGSSAAVRGRVPVFNGPILESSYASRRGERFQTVNWVDPAHPSLRRSNRWDGVKFYQVLRVEPGSARVLARVNAQTPVLLEKQVGAGRVLVFASTFDNVSNDFPLHASFVPFVEQTAQYLAGLAGGSETFAVDAYLDLRKSVDESTTVEVIDPEGKRALSLSEASSARGLPLSQKGFYEVRRSNGRRELVAVNTDRRESDFDLIPKETLSLWENTGEGVTASSGSAELEPEPRSLWWYVMLGVLVLILAESWVANRYLTVRKEAA